MKTAESKTSSTAAATAAKTPTAPFFSQEPQAESAFFGGEKAESESFFSPKTIQPKLTIGAPNDHYEQQADAVADQVVKSIGNKQSVIGNATPSVNGTSTATSTPCVQTKCDHCDHCEQEEKLQKKDDIESAGEQIQKKPIFDSAAEPPPDDVQRKSEGNTEGVASPDFANQLSSSKGGGTALPAETQQQMGNAIGADFSGVRVHTGNEAAKMSENIGAQAFTHGNDVYFNEGKYNPSSTEGSHLLAHELTHTVQQGAAKSSVQKKEMIQRTSSQPSTNEFILKDGTRIDRTDGNKQIQIPAIELPVFKKRHEKRFKNVLALRQGGRGQTKQGEFWRESVRESVKRILTGMLPKAKASGGYVEEGNIYFFKTTNKNSQFYLFGTPEELEESALVPFWDKDGLAHTFDIDHIVEDQLVNKDDDPVFQGLTAADKASNYELLDNTANSSSGAQILHEINRRLRAAIKLFSEEFPAEKPLTLKGLRYGYKVNFLSRTFTLETETKGEPNNYWLHVEINQGQHLKKLQPVTGRELRLLNRKDRPVIFTSGQGGERRFVEENKLPYKNWLPRVDLTGIELNDNPAQAGIAGWITVDAYSAKEAKDGEIVGKYDNMRWRLKSVPGVYGGAIDKEYFKEQFGQTAGKSLRLPGLSPIQLNKVDITSRGILAEGKVLPTMPIISKADVDIIIDGRNVRLRKLFELGEINIPRPFEIRSASLEVFYGNKGIGATGEIDFAIEKVGSGRISATASTKGGFELEGEFNFEKGIFDESHIKVRYEKKEGGEPGKFSFTGHAVKTPKKGHPIKKAQVDIKYENGILDAIGTVDAELPGIKQGIIHVIADPNNVALFADFIIDDKIPGVKGGTLHFAFETNGDDFKIMATANIQTKFSGIPDVALAGSYDSAGIFLFQGKAKLSKGKFSGTIEFGVTNQEVDAEGKLTGKKGNKIIAFGTGEVEMQINKWLKGKIGAKITPDAKVILFGALVPAKLIPINEKPFEKDISIGEFSLPKFTLFGIPHIAEVYVTASGGINFYASIGPLYLKDAYLSFKDLDIDEPEKAVISGGGSLDIPAKAGVRLWAKIQAGVGILVIDVSLNLTGSLAIEVSGNIGIRAAFDYSVNDGFKMKDLTAYLKAKTELIAKLTGGVSVDLDLWIKTINLYSKDWDLGEKRFPLGLDLDLNFPLGVDKDNNIQPELDKVKYAEPKFDQDTIKKGAMGEEDDEAKKAEIRAQVKRDMHDATKPDFTPTAYKEEMKVKYEDTPELQTFVLQTIDEEARLIEYEEFEKLKVKIKQLNIPLSSKLGLAIVFAMFNKYITAADVQAFKAELIQIEEEKKLKEEQEKQAAAQEAERVKQEKLAQEEAQKKEAAAKAKRKSNKPKKGGKPKNSKVQTKLKIGARNDRFEQEADAVADQVIKGNGQTTNGSPQTEINSNPATSNHSEVQRKPIFESNADVADADVQKKCAACEEEETVQRSADTEGSADSTFESGLATSKGGGSPLPTDTRQKMESSMGADFSGVRVHTDSEAAELSNNIGAQAFTHGNDVYFNDGKYNPSTTEGSHLLAHELTHTVQQGASTVRGKFISASSNTPMIQRNNNADTRLPLDQAEAIAHANASTAPIQAAIVLLQASAVVIEKNAFDFITQQGITINPLTPRHDSLIGTPIIKFFIGANYAQIVNLPETTQFNIDKRRNTVNIRTREEANVDNLLTTNQIKERIVQAVNQFATLLATGAASPSVFEQYRAEFNSWWDLMPFAGLSNNFDLALNSRGPKTTKARAIFDRILNDNATIKTAYDSGKPRGIKDRIDTYVGPDSLNNLISPRLQTLRAAFLPFATPVPTRKYNTFRNAIQAASANLNADDRLFISSSNEWQSFINKHVTSVAQRQEIGNIIQTPPAAVVVPPAVVPLVVPPVVPPPAGGGAANPQQFIDSIHIDAPVANIVANQLTEQVPLTPKSNIPNPNVNVSTQFTVTPANRVQGSNISPISVWQNGVDMGAIFNPDISNVGTVAMTAHLDLPNAPAGLAPAAPIPDAHFTIQDNRLANVLANWRGGFKFTDGGGKAVFAAGSVVRYQNGSQNFSIGAALLNGLTNPGLTLGVKARVMRGAAIIASNANAETFPSGALHSTLIPLNITPPAVVPVAGDNLSIDVDLLDAAGAIVDTKSIPFTVLPEAIYPEAQATAAAVADNAHFHDASAAGLLGKMIAAGGNAARVASAIQSGMLTLVPLTIRHDSAAFVRRKLGGPDPSKVGYFAGTSYISLTGDNSFVDVAGAAAMSMPAGSSIAHIGRRLIVANRTTDVLAGTQRADDVLIMLIVHEAVHALDTRDNSTLEKYKTEFRAYWMDGRFGPPFQSACPAPPNGCREARFDPTIPLPGPKSPRAKAIFDHLYGSVTYPFVKPAYDNNEAGFRTEVDNYLIPDGINLLVSERLEVLRGVIESFLGLRFNALRNRVQAFMGAVAPAPAQGVLDAEERAFIANSRAWRALLDRKISSRTNRTLLKTDLGIPQ